MRTAGAATWRRAQVSASLMPPPAPVRQRPQESATGSQTIAASMHSQSVTAVPAPRERAGFWMLRGEWSSGATVASTSVAAAVRPVALEVSLAPTVRSPHSTAQGRRG